MNTVEYNGYQYTIPSNWNELDKNQFLKLAAILILFYSHAQLTPQQWRYLREECLLVLLNFKRGFLRHNKAVTNLQNMDRLSRIALLNHDDILPWIFEKVELKAYLVKDFRLCSRTYVGPYTNLMDVTAEEFIEAHIYSQLYETTKKENHLISLIALLYRPIDKHFHKRATTENVADMRILNSIFSQEAREKRFKKHLSPALKTAIYLQYCSHLENFSQHYPAFFKQTESSKQQTTDLKSYLVLIKNVSGGKFGNYNETKCQRADLFFNEVEDKIEEYNQAKHK